MLIIFDWDGTLIDSAGKIATCMRRAALDCGLEPPSEPAVHNIIGLGLDEGIQLLFPGIGTDALAAMRASYSQHFVAADQVPCDLFPGVLPTLECLLEQEHTLAVATGKSRRGLNRVLGASGLGRLFRHSRCADETRSKPDPLMLHQLCEEAGHAPGQALMVGDTEFDLEMARRAGMPAVGVRWGVHSDERMLACEPLGLLDAIEELQQVVASLSQQAAQ